MAYNSLIEPGASGGSGDRHQKGPLSITHGDHDDEDPPPPDDPWGLAYWLYALLGGGILCPWNALISATGERLGAPASSRPRGSPTLRLLSPPPPSTPLYTINVRLLRRGVPFLAH